MENSSSGSIGTQARQTVIRLNFHRGRRPRWKPYWQCMGEVYQETRDAIIEAYETGVPWVSISHGCSTSGPFKMTSRSVVRGLLRDKSMTPYILRAKSAQFESWCEVRIRPKRRSPVSNIEDSALEHSRTTHRPDSPQAEAGGQCP